MAKKQKKRIEGNPTLQVGHFELRHLNIGQGHVAVLEVRTVQGSIEERGADEVAVLEIGVANDALLESDPLQVLIGKILIVQVHAPGD